MKRLFYLLLLCCSILACEQESQETPFSRLLESSPSVDGKPEYLASPFVTAGNRVYVVGHQDGSFPDLGWHIKGEMGGIWNHPIKLMDGYEITLTAGEGLFQLNQADLFTNYPTASRHAFEWKEQGIKVNRWQFVPDGKQGLVVQLEITNQGEDRELNVAFTGISDLRPTWLGAQTNMIDHKDEAVYDKAAGIWKVKDAGNEWHVVFGTAHENGGNPKKVANETPDNTVSSSIENTVFVPSGQSVVVNYVIAGSYTSEQDAVTTYRDILGNIEPYFQSKLERYKAIKNQSKLTVPDKQVEQAFEWLKYNCDWLVRTVPEIGSGMMAGIPDYPWWFGVDSEYALKGYMAIGQKETVYNTIRLLDSLSEATNGNGRIVHEVSTNGVVFNKGNVNETPQFASLIWEIYRWNGDKTFLEKYFPTIQKGMEWLMSEKDANQNLFPDGYGMMEIHGLDSEMIDVAAYTQRAFLDASKIASELGNEAAARSYMEKADQIRTKINTEFWSEDFQSFADFIGTDEQALHLIEAAIVRADTLGKPWAVEELEQTKAYILQHPSSEPRPFVLHHNWVVNTPMEMEIADEDKALKALETAEKFVNPFGVFVTGIDRDESAGTDDGSFAGSKSFSYTGAVMTLPTSVQAIAEHNYGRSDKALDYIRRMSRSFSFAFPGSIYEVSPDYGMITQAWNIYGFAIPVIQQFFGINPVASERKVIIQPEMPEDWKEGAIEQVAVGDNSVSVFYEKQDGVVYLKVEQDNPDWLIEVVFPASKDGLAAKVLNSTSKPIVSAGEVILSAKGTLYEAKVQYE